MAMNRILEFTPSQEEAVVSRILVLVHQTVDECFPAVAQNRQFTKTVFSDNESTVIGAPGIHGATADDAGSGARPSVFADNIDTASDAAPDDLELSAIEAQAQAKAPPIVPPQPPRPHPSLVNTAPTPHLIAGPGAGGAAAAIGVMDRASTTSKGPTRLDTALDALSEDAGPDWISRITLVFLIAGLILLAYATLS